MVRRRAAPSRTMRPRWCHSSFETPLRGSSGRSALRRRTFRPLRQLILGIEPRRTVRSPDVHFGAIGNRRIETAHPKQDGVLAFARGDDMRAALAAEIPGLARRGFKASEEVFTLDSAKAVAGNVGDGRKRRSMCLAARAAVAMNDRPRIGVDFVRHVSAQAVSSKHGASRSNKNPAEDITLGRDFRTLENRVAYFRLFIST